MNLREEFQKCELVPSILALGFMFLYAYSVYFSYIHGADINGIRLEVKEFMVGIVACYFINKHYRKKSQKES